ncbi:MAG TPA: LysM peptidoglycan-binding domain-containing protein [Candidatus Lachnoclostridium pullistercoris]|uniref:LysM peptidoglycan-binding domain-containing protein n=1 Tax=Candidatus Lachnoclostridium pullistercoris TaxID=2838632 RepID=A0A9D2PBL1_9FIRM|nr:LysM peptidoglycan-binding domain-containing protein [Candidatus Lachnoclostridium pullistercoris]
MKRTVCFLLACILTSLVFFGYSLNNVLAKDSRPEFQRYYKSVMIRPGDSLWSLAETYRGEEMSVEEYIEELRFMNQLRSDTIHSGQYLTVLYFE